MSSTIEPDSYSNPKARWKCTLKPGVNLIRGAGAASIDGFVYLYGDGPWDGLTVDDLATRLPADGDWPVTMQEGRLAPGA